MVIDHPYGLHEGVADCRPHKLESPNLKVLAHGVRFDRVRRQFARSPRIPYRTAVHKSPDVGIETAKLLPYGEECARISNRGRYLEPIADDSRVRKQFLNFSRVIVRDDHWIKMIERLAIVVSFP